MTDMTDETKGDGMTLDEDTIRSAQSIYEAECGEPCDYFGIEAVLKAHLAAQSAMRVDETTLDAPARVGAVTFGKGTSWASVIACAKRAYNAKPLPPEAIKEMQRMLAEIKADAEKDIYGVNDKPQP
jgi:hypothetical protein